MATTDYRTLLAEVLEKRCHAGYVSDIFPSVPSTRLDVLAQRV